MKIIHFSDIHTGGRFSMGALFDKRVIGTVNYHLTRRKHVIWDRLKRAIQIIEKEKPDIVINTGDLTSVSQPAEFDEAVERLQSLTSNTNFEFLNVPGNHDYYVDRPEVLSYRNKTFNLLNREQFPIEDFPLKHETEHLIFILVDESRPNSGTQSSGYFKQDNLTKINKWIADAGNKKVILVGHYPLRTAIGEALAARRSLENGELLYALLEKGKISVNLCGHIHAAFKRVEKSGSIEVCAGSLTIGGRLNKLEFNCNTGNFSQSWIEVK